MLELIDMSGEPTWKNSSWDDPERDQPDLVSQYLDTIIERTLVGDGLRPIPAEFLATAPDSESAFRAFLEDNSRRMEGLRELMTPDQQSTARTLYQVWFSDYLHR